MFLLALVVTMGPVIHAHAGHLAAIIVKLVGALESSVLAVQRAASWAGCVVMAILKLETKI